MFRLVTPPCAARFGAIEKPTPFQSLRRRIVSNQKNREVRLKSRPVGVPTLANFDIAETAVPTPATGQVLVRNIYMSVDPYMRGRMVDRQSYVPPFQIGEVMQGGAIGQVVNSNNNKAFK